MVINESMIVSVDFHDGDNGVLIVGKQESDHINIINAFQGEEAYDLYKKLTTVKTKKGSN